MVQKSANLRWVFLWAGFFTCLHLCLCLLCSPFQLSLPERYQRLNQWDSFHYLDIALRGYQMPVKAFHPEDVHSNRVNVGYFPAYPLLCQKLHRTTGIPYLTLLPLVSQVFCFIFWLFFLLTVRLGHMAHRRQALQKAWMIFLFPSSFFLVVGYSEALFLASLLVLIFSVETWVRQTRGMKWNFWVIASALAGGIAGGTRLVGVLVSTYPLFRSRTPRALFLSFCIGLESLAYFVGCHVHFGVWNAYFKAQQIGWGNQPDFSAILNPLSYLPLFFFEDSRNSICRISNLAVLLLGWLVFKQKKSPEKWPLLLLALGLFLISLAGKAQYGMDSMVRYNFPVFTLLIVALKWDHKLLKFLSFPKLRLVRRISVSLLILLQLWMIYLFVKGGWVA